MNGSIFSSSKNLHRATSVPTDAEALPLLQANDNPDRIFSRTFDVELEKIISFHQLKELEIFREVDKLLPHGEDYDNDTNGRHTDLAVNRPRWYTAGECEIRLGIRNSAVRIVKRRRSSVASSFGTDGVEDSDEEEGDKHQPTWPKAPTTQSATLLRADISPP